MAVFSGYGGLVRISGTPATVVEIDKWSLDVKRKQGDSASFGDAWDEKTPLTGSWTARCSGRLDTSDTNGQVVLQNAALNGTGITDLRLYVDYTNTKYYKGNAVVDTVAISADRGGFVDVDFTLEGNGSIAYFTS